MAMPQRDETSDEITRLDALLEYAVMHGNEASRGVAASLRFANAFNRADAAKSALKQSIADIDQVMKGLING